MITQYMKERRTGHRAPGWTPLTCFWTEDRLPRKPLHTDEYCLELTVSVTFRATEDSHASGRHAAEREVLAYLYRDARAHLEAVASSALA